MPLFWRSYSLKFTRGLADEEPVEEELIEMYLTGEKLRAQIPRAIYKGNHIYGLWVRHMWNEQIGQGMQIP
jgi:hypothetical protein